MQRFVVGQPATLTVDIKDASGAPVAPTNIAVEVRDGAGNLLEVVVPLLASPATIAINNELGTPPLRGGEVRSAKVTYDYLDEQGATQTNSVTITYLVEAGVQVGRNSVVAEAAADLFAQGLEGWAAADDAARRRALIEAFFRLARLRLRVNLLDGPIPADAPSEFVTALMSAQVLEADTILGGEPEQARRKTGLLSESAGESSMMFRTGGVMKLPVSPRTLEALRGFFTLNTVIGRA